MLSPSEKESQSSLSLIGKAAPSGEQAASGGIESQEPGFFKRFGAAGAAMSKKKKWTSPASVGPFFRQMLTLPFQVFFAKDSSFSDAAERLKKEKEKQKGVLYQAQTQVNEVHTDSAEVKAEKSGFNQALQAETQAKEKLTEARQDLQSLKGRNDAIQSGAVSATLQEREALAKKIVDLEKKLPKLSKAYQSAQAGLAAKQDSLSRVTQKQAKSAQKVVAASSDFGGARLLRVGLKAGSGLKADAAGKPAGFFSRLGTALSAMWKKGDSLGQFFKAAVTLPVQVLFAKDSSFEHAAEVAKTDKGLKKGELLEARGGSQAMQGSSTLTQAIAAETAAKQRLVKAREQYQNPALSEKARPSLSEVESLKDQYAQARIKVRDTERGIGGLAEKEAAAAQKVVESAHHLSDARLSRVGLKAGASVQQEGGLQDPPLASTGTAKGAVNGAASAHSAASASPHTGSFSSKLAPGSVMSGQQSSDAFLRSSPEPK